jgi:hypothetical protein
MAILKRPQGEGPRLHYHTYHTCHTYFEYSFLSRGGGRGASIARLQTVQGSNKLCGIDMVQIS